MRLAPLPVAASLVACVAGGDAYAETRSFRCGNELVNIGDTKASTLAKCGEPVSRDARCQVPKSRDAVGEGTRPPPCVNVDEWTYRPGYGQFVTTLRFEENRLRSIEYGDRVR